MINMDKITRTKLAMLVTSVLLTVFTTIGLYYTMTVSHVSTLGNSEPSVLNFSMVIAIIIAFMWVVCLILFYEFKTDDMIKTEVHKIEAALRAIENRVADEESFTDTLKQTAFRPNVTDPDILNIDPATLLKKIDE